MFEDDLHRATLFFEAYRRGLLLELEELDALIASSIDDDPMTDLFVRTGAILAKLGVLSFVEVDVARRRGAGQLDFHDAAVALYIAATSRAS